MRHRFTIAALLLGALVLTAAATEAFLEGFGDLPVMAGLSVAKDAGVVFDTPSGRIVEAYAAGDVTRARVARFYRRTLPQLGWTRAGKGRYHREGEVLTLNYKGKDGALTVRFTLSPAKKKKGARKP
jgi:hypothetical protein